MVLAKPGGVTGLHEISHPLEKSYPSLTSLPLYRKNASPLRRFPSKAGASAGDSSSFGCPLSARPNNGVQSESGSCACLAGQLSPTIQVGLTLVVCKHQPLK